MFESIINFFKRIRKTENKEASSKNTAKERLHLVLMQDRANVSADFLELMKQEIIEVIKKYIEVEEEAIDVRLTNEIKEDGTTGAPSLYANIPIVNIRNEMKKEVDNSESEKNSNEASIEEEKEEKLKEEKGEEIKEDLEDNKEDTKEEKQDEDKETKKDVEQAKEETEENVKK